FPVNIDLRCDDAGQNLASISHHRRRRLVARRFNPQNASAHQISVLLSTISNSSSSLGSHRQVLYSAGQFPRSLSETQVCRPHRRRSEEHTSELQSRFDLVCRLLLEK